MKYLGTLASADVLENSSDWNLGDSLSAIIGQSYNNFTPIQMAKYISILANRGTIVNPTLIKSIINTETQEEIPKEEIEEKVNQTLGITKNDTPELTISESTLNAVYEGMRSVTGDAGGTAYSIFSDFEIEVAGKTGSAEAGSKTNAWFVGFAPYDDPEIAVVVIVENGKHGNYTAEVVLEIMKDYFNLTDENDEVTDSNIQEPLETTIN